MCGIAGYVNGDGAGKDVSLLRKMILPLRHRGPDGEGNYADDHAGLAHARLSIIDVAGGRQPMCNEDRTLWITFNGEIFNYIELREELVKRGHRFATCSDTETILHLYEDEGEECVRRLNGQWAFAIWDAKKRELFLSRDRLGIRPLHYAAAGRTFLFASEIKSIFAHRAVSRQIDLRALDEVFTFWVTLPPRTIFEGVKELPPGHSALLREGTLTVKPYWELDYEPAADSDVCNCAEALFDLLVDATRLRLRADVPVGAYLSGGLDSTFTTALAARFTGTPLKTFSLSFEEAEYDESHYQKEAVRHLRTEHQEVRISNEDIGRVFPDVIWHTEKPVLRTAPAPLYLLSRLVRENGYKVVITGEGADEMLGGYDIFKEAKIRRFWGAQPGSKMRPLLLRRLYPYIENIQSQPDAYRKAFFHARPEDLDGPFFSHLPRWELTAKLKAFFSDDVKAEAQSYSAYGSLKDELPPAYSRWPWFCRAQYLESRYLLPGYILSSQGDRVAMAHSVEGRFPFLDYRVAEFAAALPPHLKMKVLNEKYLLKRCAGGLIPAAVKSRTKQPYRAPEAKSFFPPGGRSKSMEYVDEMLSSGRIREHGIFNPVAVGKLAGKMRNGQAIGVRDNMALVGILSTQLLIDRFISRFSVET